MMVSPKIKICGRTPMTRSMETSVPRPRHSPIPAMASLEVKKLMSVPAAARMLPEVTTVGKARFRASTMASLQGICSFSST